MENDLTGNENYFELTGGSSYRGFELPGIDCTQLFREKLSDKVQATISKGIVGCFELTVFQRNLKEGQERPWAYVCEC